MLIRNEARSTHPSENPQRESAKPILSLSIAWGLGGGGSEGSSHDWMEVRNIQCTDSVKSGPWSAGTMGVIRVICGYRKDFILFWPNSTDHTGHLGFSIGSRDGSRRSHFFLEDKAHIQVRHRICLGSATFIFADKTFSCLIQTCASFSLNLPRASAVLFLCNHSLLHISYLGWRLWPEVGHKEKRNLS